MYETIAIVLPVFGLIGIGYAGSLFGLANDRMIDGLTDFLFVFCLPVMLFKLIATSTLPDTVPLGYWLSYYIGIAVIWIAASLVAIYAFKSSHSDVVITGLAAGQANIVAIGIQIILRAYGEAAAFPIALLIAVNLPLTMTIASILLERGRQDGRSLRRLLRNLATHPLLIGIFCGLVAKFAGYKPTGAIGSIVDSLAAIALPGALVSLGMAMRRYGLREGAGPGLVVTALRLIVHPAITYVLAFHVFSLPPVWAGTAVLFASTPAGINVYLFAARYGHGQGIAAAAVAISTVLMIPTSIFWLKWLGIG